MRPASICCRRWISISSAELTERLTGLRCVLAHHRSFPWLQAEV